MFTKLWYTSQVVKMDKRKMDEMMKAAMNFIYAGENERPIRPLNFRPKQVGAGRAWFDGYKCKSKGTSH